MGDIGRPPLPPSRRISGAQAQASYRARIRLLEEALEAWVAYADEISAIILGEAPSLLEDEHRAFDLESSARRLTADALRGK